MEELACERRNLPMPVIVLSQPARDVAYAPHERRMLQSAVQPLGKDVRDFLALLIKHNVRFMIVGGFAVAAHGFPRYTKDLGVWIEASPTNAERMIAVLDELGFGSLGISAADLRTPDLV